MRREDALILVEDWAELRDTIAGIEEAAIHTRAERMEADQLPPDFPLPYLTWDALAEELETRTTLHLGHGGLTWHIRITVISIVSGDEMEICSPSVNGEGLGGVG